MYARRVSAESKGLNIGGRDHIAKPKTQLRGGCPDGYYEKQRRSKTQLLSQVIRTDGFEERAVIRSIKIKQRQASRSTRMNQ